MNSYWLSTRSPLYSFLFTVPLFLIYEIGIFLTSSDDMFVLRNGADALMRQILATFGITGLYWVGVIFFIGFIIAFILQRKYWEETQIHSDYFLLMMVESVGWSVLIYFLMTNVYLLLMNPTGSMLVQQVTLAVGAGIYEEFLFRVLLIAGISVILGFIFQWSDKTRNWAAMVIAAGIFSSFHFIGEYGDFFSFNIFMVRFLAGIALGTLYFLRGFGITAWSHAVYDLIVLTRMTTQ
ncbi:MAG: CPBP family intramembrane metalloprotease [Candidatus Marinimicrobia bacterium]|jgi:membrane protease YdiL (CAAX protease family)|nr:CPBP family intramembrane metalloprotease [Candidatus Neomarinimicrobiota bacterium]MBT3848805.1 CPBP family intramembrane metalloprotease [Candidatus Neomarinimicrobiota bacterium]MBT4054594.1 CPBP family intramembrane metalloprotease [Candidatus Neomarinimicrobiota bacterium]MBT4369781.1 CPBP family intramembrane metalloprotease [Candidatus Neomarinimicrobiota bacterium]MBT4661996.1 CPBP family intramembrane metalloprotease [Candidatus Neomarinimicrobiota bacterium]|tara:strand:- start:9 stop:719 length:711 start_codon:yes stop_codon:yes gene_type:complete